MFEEGQVWTYKTRDNEKESVLTILKVEPFDEIDEVIHVYVNGLKIVNPEEPNNPHVDISHMPFSRDAVRSCVISQVGYAEIPDFSEGYDYWKSEVENGNAGVFTISVAEAVEYMEETINKGSIENDS